MLSPTQDFTGKYFFWCSSFIFFFRLTEVNYKNGDKFRGTFKDGRANGFGTIKYNYSLPGITSEFEEAEYKGNFKAGKRDGYGTMTWSDGSRFKGIWKNN